MQARQLSVPLTLLVIECSCCLLLSQGLPTPPPPSAVEVIGPSSSTSLMGPQDSRTRRDADKCVLSNDGTVPIGQTMNRLVDNPLSITSADVCFAISGVDTMPNSERWIKFLSTKLDDEFKAVGIGSKPGYQNRFCVVQFGARNIRAKIIKVNNNMFFNSTSTGSSRSQVRRNGKVADGYEALEYIVNTVPFRTSQAVARGVILVTDTGRSMLADRVNLTIPVMSHLLQQSDIRLDVISNIQVESAVTDSVVMGMLDYHTSVLYNNKSTYTRDNEKVNITSSHGNTLTNYAELAFSTGGGAWMISPLYKNISSDTYKSLVEGIAMGYVSSQSYLKPKVCEACSCIDGGNGASLTCERHPNQRSCMSCLKKDDEKCSEMDSTTGYPLQIFSEVTQQQANYVNISFHSNREDVFFECILNDSKIDHCTSPFIITGLSAGTHELLILGRTVDDLSVESKIISFEIPSKNDSYLSIKIIDKTLGKDGQEIAVAFKATSPYRSSHVTVTCQIDGGQYQICTSPIMVERSNTWQQSLTLMATDEFGGLAVTQETLHFSGESKYVLQKGSIDSRGILEILLYSSNHPDFCHCWFNDDYYNAVKCTPNSNGSPFSMFADPAVLGDGSHKLFTSCRYDSNSFRPDKIEFSLRSKSATHINCSLDVVGPFANKSAIAYFDCYDSTLSTSCTIDSLPSQKCTGGEYTFGTSSLRPGYHTLTLTVVDNISGSQHEKIQPFFVETPADYHCCPKIVEGETAVVAKDDAGSVTLSLVTTTGSCSSRDEFSYKVHWGDGASYSGTTAGHVSPLKLSRKYLFHGQYTGTVKYCANIHNSKLNKCCVDVLLPVDTRN